MIELYILRQFAAFAESGTLSEAAEMLHLSQPALSRNMKKLEEDLGVTIFTRKKNRLELNENGEYVLKLTRKLLEDAESLIADARKFDRKNRAISLGVCAPVPMWKLTPLISRLYPHAFLQTETAEADVLLNGLNNNAYRLIVINYKPENSELYCKECGYDSLMFALPKGHKFADRKSLSFADINGENVLLMDDIGFWDFVRTEKMPDSRFLMQSDRSELNVIANESTLVAFTSDQAAKYIEPPPGRVNIPISDPEATAVYYLICKAQDKEEFEALFAAV